MLKWLMLGVFLIALGYTIWHTHLALNGVSNGKKRYFIILTLIIIVCCSIIIIGPFLPAGSVRRLIVKASNYYLGFWIYLIFFFAVFDVYRLIRKFVLKKDRFNHQGAAFLGILIISACMTLYGGIHARNILVHNYDVTVNKTVEDMKDLKVVLISDWHLGYSIGYKDMKKMVSKINEQDADLVLIAGDIYDNQYDSIDDPSGIADVLSQIKSKYGVYGVYGNHDVTEALVGGFTTGNVKHPVRDTRIDAMMEKAGITMLKDQVITVADGKIQLVGRLDGEKAGNKQNKRDSLEKLLKNLDKSKPIFVLNHEPDELDQHESLGVDLLFAGHTHAGQFFPLTIMRSVKWENYWGILSKGNSTSIVTSGIGVYGPPLRLLSDSEVMVLNVSFQ